MTSVNVQEKALSGFRGKKRRKRVSVCSLLEKEIAEDIQKKVQKKNRVHILEGGAGVKGGNKASAKSN